MFELFLQNFDNNLNFESEENHLNPSNVILNLIHMSEEVTHDKDKFNHCYIKPTKRRIRNQCQWESIPFCFNWLCYVNYANLYILWIRCLSSKMNLFRSCEKHDYAENVYVCINKKDLTEITFSFHNWSLYNQYVPQRCFEKKMATLSWVIFSLSIASFATVSSAYLSDFAKEFQFIKCDNQSNEFKFS